MDTIVDFLFMMAISALAILGVPTLFTWLAKKAGYKITGKKEKETEE